LSEKNRSKGLTIITNENETVHNKKKTRTLPQQIHIAIGMKVMITENLETDLDITNGAQGEITKLFLHPNEPPLPSTPIIHLRHLPTFILVKLDRTKASQLPGLDPGVIPVEP
jgi:hypothetical protein